MLKQSMYYADWWLHCRWCDAQLFWTAGACCAELTKFRKVCARKWEDRFLIVDIEFQSVRRLQGFNDWLARLKSRLQMMVASLLVENFGTQWKCCCANNEFCNRVTFAFDVICWKGCKELDDICTDFAAKTEANVGGCWNTENQIGVFVR